MSEGACSCLLSCRQPYMASLTGCTKTPESLYGFRRNGCTKSAGISTEAWAAGLDPGFYVIDLDATLVGSHSDKEGAVPNYSC